eukprot:TRINITY_DN12132_c0_g1_i1.p1 TRINITY_DN12132_c0_g1~~TRINITY_DN12132_c0_g1_i1.p1  ORF type:complete len:192 (+),score=50.22 TRINITY_DN12132_c0_g1_i1:60-578(+)
MCIRDSSEPALNANFYIPMSLLHENFARAHKRNALRTQKFWFRRQFIPTSPSEETKDEYIELSIEHFLTGNAEYLGLLPAYKQFIDFKISAEPDKKEFWLKLFEDYVKSIQILLARAKGEIPTLAAWIRTFVTSHPDYKKDSIVSRSIADALYTEIYAISNGQKEKQHLLPK